MARDAGQPAGVSVVLLAGDPDPPEALVTSLGADRVQALGELLRRRAREWARTTFPGAAQRAVEGNLSDAVGVVLASPPGDDGSIVAIVAPALAVWRPGVGEAALDDLRAGCAVSFGPVFDGGLYLLVLSAAALAPLREAPSLDLGGRAALVGLVELAARAGFEVGMLRTERGVRRADDIRALVVDPLCDAELRETLG